MFQHLLRAPPLLGRTSILEWPLTSQEGSGVTYHEGLECAISVTSFIEVEMPGYDEVEIEVKLVLGINLEVEVYSCELNLHKRYSFEQFCGLSAKMLKVFAIEFEITKLFRIAFHWKRLCVYKPVVKRAFYTLCESILV